MTPSEARATFAALFDRVVAEKRPALDHPEDPSFWPGFLASLAATREATINSLSEPFEQFASLKALLAEEEIKESTEQTFSTDVPADLWTPAQRTKANLAALRLLDSKAAAEMTDEDRMVLLRYSGWGGLNIKPVLNQIPETLQPESVGLLHEYYTPSNLAADVARLVKAHYLDKFPPGTTLTALEPSAGVGRFINAFENDPRLSWQAVERSPVSSKILAATQPRATVSAMFFEQWLTKLSASLYGKVGLVVSNPPYGPRDATAKYDSDRAFYEADAERYFMRRGTNILTPGGLSVWLVPSGFLTGTSPHRVSFRESILRANHLDYAFRLPNALFPGANLVTDLFFLRSRQNVLLDVLPEDKAIAAGRYFEVYPQHVLGTEVNKDKAQDVDPPETAEDASGEPQEPQEPKKKGGRYSKDRYRVDGAYEGLPDVSPRPEGHGAIDTTAPARAAPVAKKLYLREAVPAIKSGPEAVILASKLGIRFEQFSGFVANNDERGSAMWQELKNDFDAWVRLHGNPTKNADLKSVAKDESIRLFLSAFSRTGDLIISQPPVVAKDYTGAIDDYPAMAAYLYSHTHALQWDDLIDFAKKMGAPPQETMKVAEALRAAGWNFTGPSITTFLSKLEPDADYRTGYLWPKYDAARAIEAAADDPNTPALERSYGPWAKEQAEHLLTAIKPLSFSDIGTYGPNEGWVPVELISQWFNDEFNPDARLDPAAAIKLVYADGLYKIEDVDYMDLSNVGLRGKGVNDAILEPLGWLNDDKELFRDKKPKDKRVVEERPEIVRYNKTSAWIASFTKWVGQSEERITKVTEAYNRKFQGFVPLTFPSDPVEETIVRWQYPRPLRAHQRSAVRRLTHNHGGLIAHDVGLGKTLLGVATIALAKQQGWAKKPVVICPNTLVFNWYQNFTAALPDYRVGIVGYKLKPRKAGGKEVINPATGKPVLDVVRENATERGRKWVEFQHGLYDVMILPQSLLPYTQMEQDFVHSYIEKTKAVWREMVVDGKRKNLMKARADKSYVARKKSLAVAVTALENATAALADVKSRFSPGSYNYYRVEQAQREFDRAKAHHDEVERKVEEAALAVSERGEEAIEAAIQKFVDEVLALPDKGGKKKGKKKAEPKKAESGESEDDEATGTDSEGSFEEDDGADGEIGVASDSPEEDDRYDVGVTWGSIGCDFLIVDESQNYKNLYMPPENSQARYMSSGKFSKRAWQLDFRAAEVRERTGGSGVVLLSATPAKNNPLEYYNALQFVDHDAWTRIGIFSPGQWIARYVLVEKAKVIGADGIPEYLPAAVDLKNKEELEAIFRRYTDFKSAVRSDKDGNVPEDLRDNPDLISLDTLPDAVVERVLVPMNAVQRAAFTDKYNEYLSIDKKYRMRKMGARTLCASISVHPSLVERGPEIHYTTKTGEKKTKQEALWQWGNANKLEAHLVASPKMQAVAKKILAYRKNDEDARKRAQDRLTRDSLLSQADRDAARARLTNEKDLPADVEAALRADSEPLTVEQRARLEAAVAHPGCAHLIFLTHVTAHRWLRTTLIEAGIPADKIGMLNNEATHEPEKRQAVAEAFTGRETQRYETAEGTVVLEGFAPTLDVVIANQVAYEGLNLQTRTCAIHHLDLPWNSADLIQRNGRSVRQGNIYNKVDIYYYITERSLDGLAYDKIVGKSRWMKSLIPGAGSGGGGGNPAADVEIDEREIQLALCPDAEQAEKLRAQWKENERKDAIEKTSTGANRLLRTDVVSPMFRITRGVSPKEKTELTARIQAALEKLAKVNPDLWPYYPIAVRALDAPMIVPMTKSPIFTGMVFKYGEGDYLEVGRIDDANFGNRTARSYKWNWDFAIPPSGSPPRGPTAWDTVLPEDLVPKIPDVYDAVAEEDFTSTLSEYVYSWGDSNVWSKFRWYYASDAFLEKMWASHFPRIFNRLKEYHSQSYLVPFLTGNSLSLHTARDDSTGWEAVLRPDTHGWVSFLSRLPQVKKEAAHECAAFWFGREIPAEMFTKPPRIPAPRGNAPAAPPPTLVTVPAGPTSPPSAAGLPPPADGSLSAAPQGLSPKEKKSMVATPEEFEQSLRSGVQVWVRVGGSDVGRFNQGVATVDRIETNTITVRVLRMSRPDGTVLEGVKIAVPRSSSPSWNIFNCVAPLTAVADDANVWPYPKVGFRGAASSHKGESRDRRYEAWLATGRLYAAKMVFDLKPPETWDRATEDSFVATYVTGRLLPLEPEVLQAMLGVPKVAAYHSDRFTVLHTTPPLACDVQYRLAISPLTNKDLAACVLEYSRKTGFAASNTAELAWRDGKATATLFKHHNGSWQLSFWDPKGPVGHTGGDPNDTRTPEDLVTRAMDEGYIEFAPGLTDSWAPNFDPETLKSMSAKG